MQCRVWLSGKIMAGCPSQKSAAAQFSKLYSCCCTVHINSRHLSPRRFPGGHRLCEQQSVNIRKLSGSCLRAERMSSLRVVTGVRL